MKKTALNQTHQDQGGKMVEFAGYSMPVQYQDGMLKEHEWVRSGNVGLFDVSHMGQFILEGENSAEFLNKITPSNFIISKPNLAKYTVLTNANGGIIDDLIITKIDDKKFFIVLNAACKEKDTKWITQNLPSNLTFTPLDDRSLIAIQGQRSEELLNQFIQEGNLSNLPYMNMGIYKLNNGEDVFISRTGYTGEDGFEVSIKNEEADQFWTSLCQEDYVKPIGLGARDSLRLEMGYPLYGHDLDDTTSPIEAGLSWVVSKSNDNFFGANRIKQEKESGKISRKRLGVKLLEKGIARENTEIKKDGEIIGKLTSGGFSPNLKVSIGQGYFDTSKATIGDNVVAVVRNREIPAVLTSPIFVEAKTKTNK
ncbi:MAG: glycine cleavage system aminomethyltransferase GcvT [Rickettsiales bacterium]|nr:glycine cleavage system aminomethyltransferase GcvT [Rickettsiales bacterium]